MLLSSNHPGRGLSFLLLFAFLFRSSALELNRAHGLSPVVKPHRVLPFLIVPSPSACQALDFFRRIRVKRGNHKRCLRQRTPDWYPRQGTSFSSPALEPHLDPGIELPQLG